MGLFDRLKEKSIEKMLQKMSGAGSPQEMLKSLGADEAEVSEAMQAMKGMNFSQMMGLFKAFSPGEPVTAEKVSALFDPAMIEQLARKLKVSGAEAPQKIAEVINAALAQIRASQ